MTPLRGHFTYPQDLPMTTTTTRWIAPLVAWLLVPVGADALPTQAQNRSAQDVARKTFPSTVLLVLEDANGQPLSLGSGFFVRDGEVVSNLHVVEGGARGYAKIVGQKAKYEIEGITAIDAERDLVLLKLSGARAPKLALGSSESAQVGEVVYAVGNPQGLEGTFSQGIVSSIREVGTDKVLQIGLSRGPVNVGTPRERVRGELLLHAPQPAEGPGQERLLPRHLP
jgi:S1-C subfamily serine protease